MVLKFPDLPLCEICKKRTATKLCDMPRYRASWAGHPPKVNGLPDYGVPMQYTVTCDRKVCDKCSVDQGGDIDFCIKCINEMRDGDGRKT